MHTNTTHGEIKAGGLLTPYFERLASSSFVRWQGRLTQVTGQLVESEGPFCSVGELCHIVNGAGRVFPGEVVGFRGSTVLSMPLERPEGLRLAIESLLGACVRRCA